MPGRWAPYAGTPCQSARPHGRGPTSPGVDGKVLCGLPSSFVWLGVDPLVLHLSAKQLKKYKPTTLIICADCAMQLAHDFAWQIRDRAARLERLDVQPLRITCHRCKAATKIMWDDTAPPMNPGMIQFCPRCGAQQIALIDPEADYWDILTESFGSKVDGTMVPFPRQLLQMLYSEWNMHDRRYPAFKDYVADQMKQFDNTGEFEAATNAE